MEGKAPFADGDGHRTTDWPDKYSVAELNDRIVTGFSKALGVPRCSEIEEYVTTGRGRLPGTAMLLAWDANSIHDFVFDTTNATGIRGASVMLRELDSSLRSGKHIGIDASQVLFAGGGSGMAVVAAERCDTVMARLHELFAAKTIIATCTTAAVALPGDGGFHGRVQAVEREMSRGRVVTGPDAEPAVPFFALRCQVCGSRAAARTQARMEGQRVECEACFERIRVGKEDRRHQDESPGFEEIADQRGFFSVVYLDGNRIGKRLRALVSPFDRAQVSAALMEVMKASFERVAATYGLISQDADEEPRYQLPICAGDDLVAILPGEVAVPFTRDLMQQLEGAFDDDLKHLGFEEFGSAAGIAIGKATFPVRHLLDEAEALLRTAKERVYREGARSALSFAVVTDGSPRAESAVVDCWQRGNQQVLLSGLPYTLCEMQRFSDRFRKFFAASIGRSQLYEVRRRARHGPAQLRNHILFQVGRQLGWQQLINNLAGDQSAFTDADRCMEQVLPEYGGRRVLDIADMITLQNHWREPAGQAWSTNE